jgi:hypothetical protein
VAWTIFEAAAGVASERGLWIFADTHAAGVLHFGLRDQHQLRLGLGFGLCGGPPQNKTEHPNDDGEFFLMITPTVQCLYQTTRRFFFGVGLRTVNPVTGHFGPASGGTGYPRTAVLLSVPIGWAALP